MSKRFAFRSMKVVPFLLCLSALLGLSVVFSGAGLAAPVITDAGVFEDEVYTPEAFSLAINAMEIDSTQKYTINTNTNKLERDDIDGKIITSVVIRIMDNIIIPDNTYLIPVKVKKNVTISGANPGVAINKAPRIEVATKSIVLTLDQIEWNAMEISDPNYVYGAFDVSLGTLSLENGTVISTKARPVRISGGSVNVDKGATLISENKDALYVTGGTVVADSIICTAPKGSAVYLGTSGTVTADIAFLSGARGIETHGGTFNLKAGRVENTYLDGLSKPAAIYVDGGKVNVTDTAVIESQSGPAVYIEGNNPVVSISDGTFTGATSGVVMDSATGKLEINDVNEIIGADGPGLEIKRFFEMKVYDGKIAGHKTAGISIDGNGTATIFGGDIRGVGAGNLGVLMINAKHLDIKGGTITGEGGYGLDIRGGTKVSISGGTINGYQTAMNAEGTITGGISISNCDISPLNPPQAGLTAIHANMNAATTMAISGTTGINAGDLGTGIRMRGGILTIKDSVTINGSIGIDAQASTAKITITKATIYAQDAAVQISGAGADLTISDGLFEGKTDCGVKAENQAKVKISGGSFYGATAALYINDATLVDSMTKARFEISPNTQGTANAAIWLENLPASAKAVTLSDVVARGANSGGGNTCPMPGPGLRVRGSSTQVRLNNCVMDGGQEYAGQGNASPALIAEDYAKIYVQGKNTRVSSGSTTSPLVPAYEERNGGEVIAAGTIVFFQETAPGVMTPLPTSKPIVYLVNGAPLDKPGGSAVISAKLVPDPSIFNPAVESDAVISLTPTSGTNAVVAVYDSGPGNQYKLRPLKAGTDSNVLAATAGANNTEYVSAKLTVIVSQKASRITIKPSVNPVYENATMTFTATLEPKGSDTDIAWTLTYSPASGVTSAAAPEFVKGVVAGTGGAQAIGASVTMKAGTRGEVTVTATSNNPDPNTSPDEWTTSVTIPIEIKPSTPTPTPKTPTPTPTSTPTPRPTPTPRITVTPTPTPPVTVYITLTPSPSASSAPSSSPASQGWLPSASEPIGDAIVDVRNTWLNIRDYPGISGRIIGNLRRGDEVVIYDLYGDWYFVRSPRGVAGWVHGAYLNFDGDLADDPTEPSSLNPTQNLPAWPTVDPSGGANVGTVRVTTHLNVRGEPSLDGAKIGALSNGERVEILDQYGEWYYIDYKGGARGYAHSRYITRNDPGGWEAAVGSNTTGSAVVANCTALNMRAGPSVGYEIVAVLPKGSNLWVHDRTGNWCRVEAGGMVGYVYSHYVMMQ